MTGHQVVHVDLKERSYDICIGTGLLSNIGVSMESLHCSKRSKVLLITDDCVLAAGHVDEVMRSVNGAGYSCEMEVIPQGEASKSLGMAERLWQSALDYGLDRQSTILALGGGVVGDLAGFVAATYMRGIGFIQLPTTIQAHDASVGGKVAIDLPRGKNVVGAFHQPLEVIYDVDTLRSLPERQVRSGMAEVIKHGAIRDAAFFEWIEDHRPFLTPWDTEAITELLARSCSIKADIVAHDERESGDRALLNFGHTIGHALEAWSGYGRFSHGEAISMGMVAAASIGQELQPTSEPTRERLELLLQTYGLPTKLPGDTNVDAVCQLLYKDKKTVGGELTFVLLDRIGHSYLHRGVTAELARTVMLALKEDAP